MNKEELLALNNSIKEDLNHIHDCINQKFEYDLKIKNLELDIKKEIIRISESIEGKALSNDIKRKSAIEQKLNDNAVYISTKEKIKDIEEDIELCKIGVSHKKRKLQIELVFINGDDL